MMRSFIPGLDLLTPSKILAAIPFYAFNPIFKLVLYTSMDAAVMESPVPQLI